MDRNQKLRIASFIIFSSPTRQFNLEGRISQQMMVYKQISIFIDFQIFFFDFFFCLGSPGPSRHFGGSKIFFFNKKTLNIKKYEKI